MAALSLHCLMAAAMAYHVSVPALQAIRTVEGGQQGQEVCQNRDGSCDLGPFQVNDKAWVGTLAGALRADRTKVREKLRDDGCWNAQVASWILRQQLDQSGGQLQTAIGDYHSHWRPAHDAYLRKVDLVLQSLSPTEPPPAMPGAGEDESPGALRIPSDVAGLIQTPPAGPQAKGKMIRIGKPAATGAAGPVPADDPAAPAEVKPDDDAAAKPDPDAAPPPRATRTAPAPKIYRGTGGGS